MRKELNISIVVGSVLSILVLVLCIVFGVFTTKEYGQTIVDKTNKTIEAIFGDKLEELTYYNKDYENIYVPKVTRGYYETPNLRSNAYIEYTSWGGYSTKVKLYALCEVSDYQYNVKNLQYNADCSKMSKKQIAFQQVNETVALTNVSHMSGIMLLPTTWIGYVFGTPTGSAVYKSESNLEDFNTFTEYSYFEYQGEWYALSFKKGFNTAMAYIYKALLLEYREEIAKAKTFSKETQVLLNNLCEVYSCDAKKNIVAPKLNRNILANVIFTYKNKPCDNDFVLKQGITPIDY